MKKLRNKVFFTIFIILTTFIVLIFSFVNFKLYLEEKNNIDNVLSKIANYPELVENKPIIDNMNTRNIFLNYTVYTIILDNDGNYLNMVNHTYKENIDTKNLKNITSKIVNKHNKDYYIGNLYFNKYAYNFINKNTLIIMDNTNINNTLVSTLIVTFTICFVLEILVFLITLELTKWIIEPIENTFLKQKRFIADASHELKTPLTVINASCDAYYSDNDTKWIDNIKNETERMTKLVVNLLDLASLENNRNIIMNKDNLSNIIESSILTFESLFYEKNIKLEYHIEDNIMLNCNSDLIKELMSILIDNAIKHTKEKKKVIIELFKTNKEIILEVKNEGSIIKKEEQEKIFERFYRVDESRNRLDNRYGLGLSIAKTIVENHKGNISAYSKNNYAIFKIVWNK